MKIGILGSGNVAKTLGTGFLKNNHEVMLGSRNIEKLKEWVASNGERALSGNFSEVAKFGEIILICTLGEGALEAINIAGIKNFKNKVVIDVTNPLDFSKGFPPKLASNQGNSLAEQIQNTISDAKVVKCFNTISANIMVNPNLEEGLATQFIAGDNQEAKNIVKKLAEEFGWHIEDLGNLDLAYLLEAQAMIWITYGFKNNYWKHAFKLLKK
ncbi:MAG: NAD(P)-binding domain-containing protein [Candidatus Sericytochromatia bacterium]